jgi:hypothetical protein
LSGVCARYLEQPRRWPEIAAFNHLTRPDRIYPGDALLIPVSYLKGIPLGGVVSFVDGPVERLPRGAESWQPMTLEVELAEGDRIRTGVGGEVEITLPDAITVRIRPETELEVSAARRKGLGYTLWRLYQRTGRTISTVRELTGKQRQMSIQTPAALAGIRGTNFRLAVDGAQTTRCEVLTGRTRLEARRQSVEVNAGQGALVAQGAAPQAPRALLEPPRMEALQAVYRRLPLELMVESQGCGQALSYQLAHDAALRRILREGQVPCGRPIRIENLADGRYYLSLAALDEVGLTGMISSPVPLEVRVHPLPPFTSQPARGQPMFSARPTFSWLRVTDAQCYRVQIARDGQFQDLVEDRGAVTETRCQSGPLDPGVYHFRICSQAADGFQGEWSDAIDFRVVPPPAAQIAAGTRWRRPPPTGFSWEGTSSFMNCCWIARRPRRGSLFPLQPRQAPIMCASRRWMIRGRRAISLPGSSSPWRRIPAHGWEPG